MVRTSALRFAVGEVNDSDDMFRLVCHKVQTPVPSAAHGSRSPRRQTVLTRPPPAPNRVQHGLYLSYRPSGAGRSEGATRAIFGGRCEYHLCRLFERLATASAGLRLNIPFRTIRKSSKTTGTARQAMCLIDQPLTCSSCSMLRVLRWPTRCVYCGRSASWDTRFRAICCCFATIAKKCAPFSDGLNVAYVQVRCMHTHIRSRGAGVPYDLP